jgi:hypothetical protein
MFRTGKSNHISLEEKKSKLIMHKFKYLNIVLQHSMKSVYGQINSNVAQKKMQQNLHYESKY